MKPQRILTALIPLVIPEKAILKVLQTKGKVDQKVSDAIGLGL